jgi:hypothetical protein
MARKGAAGVGLENTVKRFLKDAPGSGTPLTASSRQSWQASVSGIIDNEKIAHDLRASLSIIIGFTELMLDEVPGKINKEQRRSLNDILYHGKRLLNLSNDIIKQLEIASANKK